MFSNVDNIMLDGCPLDCCNSTDLYLESPFDFYGVPCSNRVHELMVCRDFIDTFEDVASSIKIGNGTRLVPPELMDFCLEKNVEPTPRMLNLFLKKAILYRKEKELPSFSRRESLTRICYDGVKMPRALTGSVLKRLSDVKKEILQRRIGYIRWDIGSVLDKYGFYINDDINKGSGRPPVGGSG